MNRCVGVCRFRAHMEGISWKQIGSHRLVITDEHRKAVTVKIPKCQQNNLTENEKFLLMIAWADTF